MRDRTFSNERLRRGRRACQLAWVVLSVGCSYYSEDLLPRASSSSAGSAGGGMDSGGGQQLPIGATASTAGSDGRGGTGVPDPPVGVSGMGGDASSAGALAVGSGGEGGAVAEDQCPNDPDKTLPGSCGCGVPESCAALKKALLHRYSFDRAGMVANDSIGTADATIVGAAAASGKLTLDGTTAAFVDLPNGLISALSNASFEIWLSWAGGGSWQRIFDFGDNDQVEGAQGIGKTYLYLTPKEGSAPNALRASFTANGIGAETTVRASAALPSGSMQHLVLVVDDSNDQLRLYLNGELSALTGLQGSLSQVHDVNNWVGRSNYKDGPLGATIEELRIYGSALTNAQVAASFGFGPNPKFL